MNVPVYSDFLQSTGGDGFDPQCDLLLGQSERLAQQSTLSLRTLSAFQRVLLVIDGTVTKFLEAYALEPIEIVRISQISRPLPADHDWLQAPKGTTVFARQVLLRGRYTATVYAYASSLIVRDRLQEVVQQDLEVDGKGLGHILRESRLETYREVVWYDWEDLDDLPDAFRQLTKDAFLSRTYRVIGGGQPLMLIHEKFPSSITGE
jgi:chorismate-pyruvate lyase